MEPIVVFTGPLVDATLRQAKLEASGIDSRIPGSEVPTFDEPIFGSGLALYDVVVAPEDESRARAALALPDPPLSSESAAR